MTRFFTGGAFAALREGFARYKILGGRFFANFAGLYSSWNTGSNRVYTWQKSAQHELIIQ